MIQYTRNTEKGDLSIIANTNDKPFLVIMNTDEYRTLKDEYKHSKELLHSLSSVRLCKAEIFDDCIIGTIRVPQKSLQRTALFSFGFYLNEQSLVLIDAENRLKSWIEKHSKLFGESNTPARLFLQILEQMIDDDVLYLSHIETKIFEMEESINSDIEKDFFASLTKYRQKLSELNVYYEQLTDIGELFQSQPFPALKGDAGDWEKYAHRAERLQNHVHLLRENMLQLRELYQAKQDANQNRIMGMLTIVTTIFLPLTLITSWYGMNFVNMPEIRWRYGYLSVIIAAVLIAVAEIIYFKKKKFF